MKIKWLKSCIGITIRKTPREKHSWDKSKSGKPSKNSTCTICGQKFEHIFIKRKRPPKLRENNIWSNMKYRCHNPRCPMYRLYGGRGIKVCKRWHKYCNFIKDMGFRPSTKHSIERIDNNGNYSPANCRWATCRDQHRNMRANHFIFAMGKNQCLTDWSLESGIPISTIFSRLERGWSPDAAIRRDRKAKK